MAISAARPPATDRPMMVLDETPPPPLSWFEGVLGGAEGFGVSTEETTISLVMVTTWPSSCVLAILVWEVDVRTMGDTVVGAVVGFEGVELVDVALAGCSDEEGGFELELGAEKCRNL